MITSDDRMVEQAGEATRFFEVPSRWGFWYFLVPLGFTLHLPSRARFAAVKCANSSFLASRSMIAKARRVYQPAGARPGRRDLRRGKIGSVSSSFRLTLEYEGTRYRGFQEQKNARTVAGELRAAIEGVLGEKVELGGAGRTDAGVHALEQVAHLRTGARFRPPELAYEINERLPPDIHLLDLRPVAPRFHARHDARLRSYVYQISRRRTALAKRFVWWVNWQTVAKFGDGLDNTLARDIWARPEFAFFRWFADARALYRIDHHAHGACVWFEDLRFATPGRESPFRFGLCGPDWQSYRLGRDGQATPFR